MDINEYIASGILESYVLGSASKQEKQEVECMSHIYPEIKQALTDFQLDVEKIALANASPTPKELKDKVLGAVFEAIDEDLASESKVIQAKFKAPLSSKHETQGRVTKLLAAASIVLIIGAGLIYFSGNQKVNQLRADLQDTQNKNKALADEKDALLEELNISLEYQIAKNSMLLDSETKEITLAGTALSDQSKVRVFWNKETAEAVMKIDNLPATPTEKQYQLWAIVEGKPKDLGVLDIDFNNEVLIEISERVNAPQAFAITLETQGGNPTPNLDQLYVIGNV